MSKIGSRARIAHTNARAEAYSQAIDLAGRGLFWPVVIGVTVVLALTAYLTRQSLVAAFVGHSVWIYLGMLMIAGIRVSLFDDQVTWFVTGAWFVLFAPVSLVTTIWAGYEGLGGGLSELAAWVDLFGIFVALALGTLTVLGHGSSIDTGLEVFAGIIGYVVSAVGFVVFHVTHAPPSPGSWWVAPAGAAAALVGRAAWDALP